MGNERFGVSLLDKNRATEALLGEAMACRETGQVVIKNEDTGYTISYDYLNRFRKYYDQFVSKMIAEGSIGKVGKVVLTDNFANTFLSNNNILTTPIQVLENKKVKFFRFGIDLEVISKANCAPIDLDPPVTVEFTVASNIETLVAKKYSLTDKLSVVNNKIFKPDYTGYDPSSSVINQNLNIDLIKVGLPAEVNNSDVVIIVNTVLVCFKEV